ncbi:hypothetical protein CLIB1444_20S01178 [[Candida] jaroonii]|uniref:Uncharacterized protein n=1 Tax=[Candida] jaroonii TaxID=467808 RepID=A0ACA9YG64_9ASCO|nr:hypothetical protein CLIB1444_20S01178 [[Candida] jaroonii]
MFRKTIIRFASSIPDISETIATRNLLQGTGNGPFIELPHFSPIGNPTNLLNVKLPQSSNLNIRLGSLIAVNGDLKHLSTVNRKLSESTYFQILQCQEATSLIIGGKLKPNRQNHYKLIDIDYRDQWMVYNDENLIAWTGYNFELNKFEFLDRWSSFKTSGKGIILVNDGNEIMELDVLEGEKVIVDTNSLIASNNLPSRFSILKNDSKLPPLPKISWPFTAPQFLKRFNNYLAIQTKKTIENMGLSSTVGDINFVMRRIKYFFQNGLLFLQLNVINKLFRKSIMIEFQGPCKVLTSSNATAPNGKNFTKEEINKIFNQ